mgnify:FL=1
MILESFKSKADKIVYTINMQRYQKLHILFFCTQSEIVKLSAPILVLCAPWPCFLLFSHYFYKKPSLYIHIPIPKYILDYLNIFIPIDESGCKYGVYEDLWIWGEEEEEGPGARKRRQAPEEASGDEAETEAETEAGDEGSGSGEESEGKDC